MKAPMLMSAEKIPPWSDPSSDGALEAIRSPRRAHLIILAALTFVYVFAGKLGLRLAMVSPSATAVWPPTGIALAFFLLQGYWVWPAIFLGAFFVNITTAGTIATSVGIAAGNTLEGLVGAYLVKRFAGGRRVFERPQDTFKFAILAGLVSTAVSATFGVTSLCLGHAASWDQYRPIWLTWWLGDVGGALIVAPVLILWGLNHSMQWKRRDFVELLLVAACLLFVGQVLFGRTFIGIEHYPVSFIAIPILFWVAFRYGQRETATAILLLSMIATRGTLHGLGPFARGSPNSNLLLLQGFIAVSSVLTLAFAAAVAEHGSALEELQQAHDQLDLRVQQRTEQLKYANEVLQEEIIERKKSEGALQRLASIVESSADAIIASTLDGVISSWNPGASQLFGYSAEEVVGKPVTLLASEEQKEQILHSLEVIKRGGTERYEAKRLRKDGSMIDVEVTISPVRDKEGGIVGCSRIEHDITARKRAEAELQFTTKELAHSNAELSLFASIVAHELQEPLRKILSFGDLVKNPDAIRKHDREEYVRKMQDAAQRMQRLVEDILALSRVTTNTQSLVRVNLNEVLRDVASDFKTRLEQAGGKLEIGRLPTIMADDLQMRQLFQNLISNAYKFRKKDQALRIDVSCQKPQNGVVKISVEDNGIGFDEQYRERLFKPFQRLNRRGEYEGSGMGLAICERILVRHGGMIAVNSEAGKGSVFTVTLPAIVERTQKRDSPGAV